MDKAGKETHDCSNCRFSREIAPYKVLLECQIDMEIYTQPYTCNRWASILDKALEGKSDG